MKKIIRRFDVVPLRDVLEKTSPLEEDSFAAELLTKRVRPQPMPSKKLTTNAKQGRKSDAKKNLRRR